MAREIISTTSAPQAIGTYSQAVKVDNTVYFSGQIGLDPDTMTMAEGFEAQAHRVFKNVQAIAEAAGGTMNDCVKVNIFLIDLEQFVTLNEIMAQYFDQPYPARAALQVSRLPKDAEIEIDGVIAL